MDSYLDGIRDELDSGSFQDFKNKYVDLLDTRI